MKYNKLGKHDVLVSEVGLGGEQLENKSYETVHNVVNMALDAGVNIIDIFMSQPEIRKAIGNALGNRREKMLIQGHIGAIWENGQYTRSRELAKIKPAFQDLLHSLNTKYIDIGFIHYVDEDADFEVVFGGEFIEYLKQLKQEGVIKYIGISSHNPKVALRAVQTGLIDVLMFSINPAYDIMPEDSLLPDLFAAREQGNRINIDKKRAELYSYCEAVGVAITVMKPFAAGALLDPKRSPFGVALTQTQLLHYALTRPAVVSVLAGPKDEAEMAVLLEYEKASPAQKDYVEILSKTPSFSLKGRCMYCNHCLPCPMNINVAQVNKFLDMVTLNHLPAQSVKSHYLALEHKGGECIACESCTNNCPFDVDVVSKMRKCQEIFGA